VEGVVEKIVDVLSVKDNRKFEVHCNAGDVGELRVGTESISIKVGQSILRDGTEEMWDSVMIHGEEAEDGAFEIRVMVFHPDWEEGRQIAFVRSQPANRNESAEMLKFNFVHCAAYSSTLNPIAPNSDGPR
jgi:hypothetical protein